MGGTPPRLLGWRGISEWLAAQVECSLLDLMADVWPLLDAYRGRAPRRDDMALIAFGATALGFAQGMMSVIRHSRPSRVRRTWVSPRPSLPMRIKRRSWRSKKA